MRVHEADGPADRCSHLPARQNPDRTQTGHRPREGQITVSGDQEGHGAGHVPTLESRLPTVGVEEEYFLVDPATRALVPAASRVVARAAAALGDLVSGEFTTAQVEVKTSPCASMAELRAELARVRTATARAAEQEGLRLCASGTPVIAPGTAVGVGDHPRYLAGKAQYRAMLDDFAISAFHAHVHLPDRDMAVLAGNHLRPWLPLLVALSANSPFHCGTDTGYASWRAVIRLRFPCLGPPPYAASPAEHDRLAAAMAASEAMLDAGMPYWDIRPNPSVPTLEVRAMDVLADIDDTVALTALIRALVVTAARAVELGDTGLPGSSELLRAAYWRAARDGWRGSGVDARSGLITPFADQAARLTNQLRPVLAEGGDLDLVTAFLRRLAARGGGADRQRSWRAERAGLEGVVDGLLEATHPASGR
ncbi:glutamate--cysteine ligase [Kitasatospora sp. MBT63]|uniref:carboxylate-amine ligase n=1 Tax=Kitasatospora sp. MBT63 TaxID=1444768 RepID=UPI0009EA3ACA|nr:glutamate--cysteine ligase [Kitasatospora sp. MBT63]